MGQKMIQIMYISYWERMWLIRRLGVINKIAYEVIK